MENTNRRHSWAFYPTTQKVTPPAPSPQRRLRILAAVLLLSIAVGTMTSCEKDQPNTPKPEPKVLQTLHPYTFRATKGYDSCLWVINYQDAGERIVGRGDSIRYVFHQSGSYAFGARLYKGGVANQSWEEILVKENQKVFTPTLHRVLEYRPAPGQFVNKLPLFEPQDNAQSMAEKAEKILTGQVEGQHIVTLGAWGGYIVFQFDHAVLNRPHEYDLKITGNSIGRSAEPGCVRAGVDWNENGHPDPWEWYELAGSMHFRETTIQNYSLTYTLDTTLYTQALNTTLIDSTYIPWDDNQGQRGWVSKNTYHSNSYWPKWIKDPKITFSGVRLPDNFKYTKKDGTNPQYSLNPFPWGYVDNTTENANRGLKIEWAINAQGKPVDLPAIDFVMVYTGVNQYCGGIGETSTEITGAKDLSL